MLSSAERLKNACANGQIMHGCLITGADTEAAANLAAECASIILFGEENTEALRSSADYFDINGSIKIDDFRELRREFYKTAFNGKNRAVVIRDAHLLNTNVINAMLKLLEEPPAGIYFLLTGLEQRILPTIRSRCAVVRLESASRSSVREHLISLGASRSDADAYAAMGMGIASRSVRLYSDEGFRTLRTGAVNAIIDMLQGKLPFSWVKSVGKDRNAARDSVEFMLTVCHDMLMILNGKQPDASPDVQNRLCDIASNFTTNQICCIINKLTDAAMRLGTNASPSLILDGLIANIVSVRGGRANAHRTF